MKFNIGKEIRVDVIGRRGELVLERHIGRLKDVKKNYIIIQYKNYKDSYNKGDIIAYMTVGQEYKFYQKNNGAWEQIKVNNPLKDLREYIA